MYIVSRAITDAEKQYFPHGMERIVQHIDLADLDRYMQVKDAQGNGVWRVDRNPDGTTPDTTIVQRPKTLAESLISSQETVVEINKVDLDHFKQNGFHQ